MRTGKRSFFPAPMVQQDLTFRPTLSTPDSKIKGKPSSTVLRNTKSLSELFSAVLQRKDMFQDAPAIFQERKVKLTFRGLSEISTRMAHNLQRNVDSSDVGPNSDGDTVVAYVLSDNEEDEKMITLLFATFKLGATFMPLSAESNVNDLSWALKLVKPSLVITGANVNEDLMEAIHQTKAGILEMQQLWRDCEKDTISLDNSAMVLDHKEPKRFVGDGQSKERTVAIYFTAGSVSSPHAVRIGIKEVFNRIHWHSKVFPTILGDAYALTASATDCRSLCQIMIPFLAGKPLTIINQVDQFDPPVLIGRIAELKLTRISITPPVFEYLLNYLINHPVDRAKLASITHWTITGNTLPVNMARTFFIVFGGIYKTGVFLIAMYGSTEVLGEACYEVFFNSEDVERKTSAGTAILSVGVPIANTSVAIVDAQDKYLPLGQRGEVVFKGASLATGGYVGQGLSMLSKFKSANSLFKTQERKHMLFRTGDIGRVLLDKNGIRRLYIEGRVDNNVKIEGKTVNFKELRGKVLATDLVHSASVFTYHRGRDSQVVIAACVLKPDATCASVMDALEVLRLRNFIPVIFAVDAIPMCNSGRVDRKQLRSMYRNILLECEEHEWEPLSTHISPEDIPTAKFLCQAIAVSIGSPLVDVVSKFDLSYWKIGGNPLNACSTVKMIKDGGYPITLQDFILANSVSELVPILNSAKESMNPESIFQYTELDEKFSFDLMTAEDEDEIILLVKNDCQPQFMPNTEAALKYWRALLNSVRDARLCMVARSHETSGESKVVGVMITGDAGAKLKLPKPPAEINYGLQLLDSCLTASKYQMWKRSDGRMARSYFIGVRDSLLTVGERVLITQELLVRTTWLIRTAFFSSLVLATTNPLVQEVATHLLDFENILEFPVARFKASDKTRPFSYADDNHSSTVLIKNVTKEFAKDSSKRLSRGSSKGSLSKIHSTISASAISEKASSIKSGSVHYSNF